MSYAEPLNICENFLSVAEKFDKDRGPLDDTNAFFSCNGYGVRKSHLRPTINQLILSTRPEMAHVSRQIKLSSACFMFIITPGTLTSKQEDDLIPLIITFITKITIKI